MTQTRDGVKNNPWVLYMKECAVRYKAGRAADDLPAMPPDAPEAKAPRVRKATKKAKVTRVTAGNEPV
jgi:hypothetical protein